MPIPQELIDELLKDTENPQDILGEDGLLKQLSKAVIERALDEFESFQIVIQAQAHLMWGESL